MLLLSCYAKGAAYQSGIEQICKDDHHFQNLVDFNQLTRLGVGKVKPKGWFKYSLQID